MTNDDIKNNWESLTESEEIIAYAITKNDFYHGLIYIEAKLKEKNTKGPIKCASNPDLNEQEDC